MEDINSQIEDVFGTRALPRGLFHAFEYALRFDLAGDVFPMARPMSRFRRAHTRACDLAEALFGGTPTLAVALASYGPATPIETRLDELARCGLDPASFTHWADLTATEPDAIMQHWDVAPLPDHGAIPDLLWLGIAAEMAVRPKFTNSMRAYVIDLDRGVALHVYDDRGMDIIATTKAPLAGLFASHQAWLSRHDLPRMAAQFGNP